MLQMVEQWVEVPGLPLQEVARPLGICKAGLKVTMFLKLFLTVACAQTVLEEAHVRPLAVVPSAGALKWLVCGVKGSASLSPFLGAPADSGAG